MGLLTDDMTRLVLEINSMRNTREDFRNNRETGVSSMLAGFRSSRMDTAKQSAEERRQSLGECRHTVSQIKKKVDDMRRECADDICSARLAWTGGRSQLERRKPTEKLETESKASDAGSASGMEEKVKNKKKK